MKKASEICLHINVILHEGLKSSKVFFDPKFVKEEQISWVRLFPRSSEHDLGIEWVMFCEETESMAYVLHGDATVIMVVYITCTSC